MSSYKELEIYRLAYSLAIRIHKASLKLPQFETYEQGSQIRRSSKSIKDNIVEGFGRRKYKAEYLRYLVFAQASCDEATDQAKTRYGLRVARFSPRTSHHATLYKIKKSFSLLKIFPENLRFSQERVILLLINYP